MHAAAVLMDCFKEYVEPSISAICDSRDWLLEEITTRLGLRCWGADTNHVLVDFKDQEKAFVVVEGLAKRGIYVKGDFPIPLNTCAMITCGSRELMQEFYSNLESVYNAE